MAFVKTTIVNCKLASIRRKPWIVFAEDDVVGVKKLGDVIEIDPSSFSYDWKDRKFYKTKDPSGWIHSGCVEYEGG